jgi:hypothetical protein
MFGPRSVHPHTIHQRSKGCFVRTEINQRSIQKAVDVQVLLSILSCTMHKVQLIIVKICLVVLQRTSSLKDKSVRPH